MRLPFAVIMIPATLITGFDGEWFPGSHCGIKQDKIAAGFTGIVSWTFSTRSVMFVRSTASEIVPGYGTSSGATMGGGSGAGCGPGESCAYPTVVRTAQSGYQKRRGASTEKKGIFHRNLSKTADHTLYLFADWALDSISSG